MQKSNKKQKSSTAPQAARPASQTAAAHHDASLHDRVRDLDLNLIAVFDCLSRFNSVGVTAAQLGITQSAASRALGRLRLLLDDPLFVKTKNLMLPTAKATYLAPTVAQIMALVRDCFLPELTFNPATAERTITLAMPDLGEVGIMPTAFALFRQEAPNCTIRIAPVADENLQGAIERGAIDLVISGAALSGGDMMQQVLFVYDFIVVCHNSAPYSKVISAEEYANAEHVVFRSPDAKPYLEQALTEQGIIRKLRYRTSHNLSIPEIVSRSPELIGTVPSVLANLYAERGLVRALKPNFHLPTATVKQYWHRRFDREPFNIWLRAMMRRAIDLSGLRQDS